MDPKIVSKINFFRILTFLILPLIVFFPGVSSRGNQGGGRGVGRFNSGGGRNFGSHHHFGQGESRHGHSSRYFGYRNPYRPRGSSSGSQFHEDRHHQIHIQERFTDFGSGRYHNGYGEIYRNRGFDHILRDREMMGMGLRGILPVGLGFLLLLLPPGLPYGGGPSFGEFYDPYYPGLPGDFYPPAPPPPISPAQLPLPQPEGNFISQNPTNVIQQDTSISQPITNIANTENNNLLVQQTPNDPVLPSSNPPLTSSVDSKFISQTAPAPAVVQTEPDENPKDSEKIKQELPLPSAEPEPETRDEPETEAKTEDESDSESNVLETEVEETNDLGKNQEDNDIEIMQDNQVDFSDTNANEGLFFLRNKDFD